ncbi:MAG: hypothetical protein M1409_08635, partial [Actinobacteria bacterium]|nr:hypothetical protein [Actinomycetota bacterium]
MKKLTKLLRWLDYNLIKILSVIFLFLIPLYPKFPLKFITYTYVAIRLEDLYIAFISLIFLIQLLRKRVTLNTKFLNLMLYFWVAIFLSFLYGVFIQKTLPYKQLAFLNTARRVEYALIFFIITSSIKSKKDFF